MSIFCQLLQSQGFFEMQIDVPFDSGTLAVCGNNLRFCGNCQSGGAHQADDEDFHICLAYIFVSGAFVGTDLWDNRLATPEEADKKFATEVLKYKWRVGQAAKMGKVKTVASPFPSLTGEYTYHHELNEDSYVVEAPDAIEPATKDAYTVMRYSESNLSAGVAYQGDYKTYIMGFPFEAVRTEAEREALMNAVLNFFKPEK